MIQDLAVEASYTIHKNDYWYIKSHNILTGKSIVAMWYVQLHSLHFQVLGH